MNESHNILVVDDEQAHCLLIAELVRKAGYTVQSANDGFKALAACKIRTPDIIVLDLHMPLMSGTEVYNRLRSQDKTKEIPVIFLASKTEPLPQFTKDGPAAEDILFKPFEPNELLARIRAILKEKSLQNELKQKEKELRELSLFDPLTTLKNPRYLNEFLKTSIKQTRRYEVPLSILVLEIDQNRELVRAVGQSGADSIVAQLANVLKEQMRDSDIISRTNTFEFTLVLTVTNRDGAVEVAERLRTKIADTTFVAGDITLQISVSIGICEFAKHMDDEGKILISHARAALAEGHASGGNMSLMAE